MASSCSTSNFSQGPRSPGAFFVAGVAGFAPWSKRRPSATASHAASLPLIRPRTAGAACTGMVGGFVGADCQRAVCTMTSYGWSSVPGPQVRDTLSRAESQLFPNQKQFAECPSGFRVVSSERKAKAAPYPCGAAVTFRRKWFRYGAARRFRPCPHCIMGQVRSFPADAPPSPRLLLSRCCASGMGSWFPVGCGRHRIEPSIRKRGLLRKAARASGTSGEEAASVMG